MTQRKTKTAEQRTFFAPLPTRAIADPRLSALHFRVLACIAYHDRMANRRKTGGGCWASHKTLCDEIGCNYTNFSTAITQLGEFGYLTRRVHPLNKKLRIYNVIYEERWFAHRQTIQIRCRWFAHGQTTAPDSLPAGKSNTDGKDESPTNIFRETGNRVRRNVERNSPEGAPIGIGAVLSQFERRIRQGQCSSEEIKCGLDLCETILDGDEYGPGDSEWERASRMLEEWGP